MSLKTKFVKAMNISLVKTLVFNIHCFGLRGGVISPRFILSKNVVIKNKGQVNANGDGKIWLGFGEIGFVDKKETDLYGTIVERLLLWEKPLWALVSKLYVWKMGIYNLETIFPVMLIQK